MSEYIMGLDVSVNETDREVLVARCNYDPPEMEKIRFYSRMRWSGVVEDLRKMAWNHEDVFLETEPEKAPVSVKMWHGDRWFTVFQDETNLISCSGCTLKHDSGLLDKTFYYKVLKTEEVDLLSTVAETWLMEGLQPFNGIRP